jgi:hypothetical protein
MGRARRQSEIVPVLEKFVVLSCLCFDSLLVLVDCREARSYSTNRTSINK